MGEITMQQLKEQRLTPAEKYVLDAIKGVKAREPDKFGDVSWYKDTDCLLKQDFTNKLLWVSLNIWSVLRKEYSLDTVGVRQLINNVMSKYTNNGQLTPYWEIWKLT
jgi:hypothetical protein